MKETHDLHKIYEYVIYGRQRMMQIPEASGGIRDWSSKRIAMQGHAWLLHKGYVTRSRPKRRLYFNSYGPLTLYRRG